jgi:hypothetical protein
MEEDDEDIKLELYIWALGLEWQQHYQELLASREVLWKVIGYRGIVSRACCEKVHTEGFFFPVAQRPLVGQGLLIIEASRSQSDTPHSLGLL